MKVKTKRQAFLDLGILFLLCFLPRLFLVFFYSYPLRTPTDEMSTIATGAYVAGLDWSEAAYQGQRYYGGGFTVLFAPLWKLISDPVVIYRVMLTVSAVLQSLIGLLACHILYHYLNVKNRPFCILSGVTLSYMQIIRTTMVYNEHMLAFMVWILVLLLCRLVSNTDHLKKRVLDSVLLMLSLSYCLTLHTRSTVLWIAVFLVILVYLIVFKRLLISWIPTVVTGALGYILTDQAIYWAKTNIWLWEEGQYLKNASVLLNFTLDTLKSPMAWQAWASTALGQVHISLVFTGGLTAVLIPVLIYYFIKSTQLQFMVSYGRKKTKCSEASVFLPAEASLRPYLFSIGIFSLLFIGAMIFAQSFTWLDKTIPALTGAPYGEYHYGYKAYTYIRYYVICLGPFVMTGLALMYHCRELIRAHCGKIFTLFACLQAVFIVFLLPHISSSYITASVYLPFALANRHQVRTRVYLFGVLICCLLFTVMYVALLRKKLMIPVLLLSLLMPYQYMYNGIVTDGVISKSNYSTANSGSVLLGEFSKEFLELEDTIYLKDMGTRVFTYQFLVPDMKVVGSSPKDLSQASIVIAKTGKDETLLDAGFSLAKLDNNEYLYIKGEDLLEAFKALGVSFS